MREAFLTALLLALPLVVSGTVHMLVVRFDLLAFARKPISKPQFGANKTWRGFVVMPIATVPGVIAAQILERAASVPTLAPLRATSPVTLGLALGLAYVLAELPNSFVKRRLGIAPGGLPGQKAWLFAFVDQADSALGCAMAYAWFIDVPAIVWAILVGLGPAIHLIANYALYVAGVRARPL